MEGDWETCLTVNETWSYSPTDRASKSCGELIGTLADVVSRGGNLLLDIGATPDGEIPPEFASRLYVVGEWLRANGESIYGAGRGLPPGAYHGPATAKDDALYLHVLGRPAEDVVRILSLDCCPTRQQRSLSPRFGAIWKPSNRAAGSFFRPSTSSRPTRPLSGWSWPTRPLCSMLGITEF